jgi:hypothetical protein
MDSSAGSDRAVVRQLAKNTLEKRIDTERICDRQRVQFALLHQSDPKPLSLSRRLRFRNPLALLIADFSEFALPRIPISYRCCLTEGIARPKQLL